jgi:hypothetical protein
MRTEDIKKMGQAYLQVLEKAQKEAMDPVDPKELKGKHKDRKDKDIDNDGDVDSTDKYLHKRRKAVSKAIKKDAEADNDTEVQTQENAKEAYEKDPKARKAKKEEDDIEDDDDEDDDDDEEENGKKKKKEPVDEISKGLAGRYIKKANINTADAADQNASKGRADKSSIGKVLKRIKGVSTAADKLTGKAKVPAKESVEIDEAATAQTKPDEKTRDTYEKQLSTRKGEKDFVDQHKSEVPATADEPKIDAINFKTFKDMTKKSPARSADQTKGDTNIIPSATPVKGQ